MADDAEELPEFDSDSKGLVSYAEAEESTSQPPPEPLRPELPEFVDRLTVGQIDSRVEGLLALLLDPNTTATRLGSWQFLAERLGMSWDRIHYIEKRATMPQSPTSFVLDQYRDENLGRILRIIRDEMRRIDVIIKLLPILSEWEERLNRPHVVCSGAAAAAAVSSKKSDVESGSVGDSGVDSRFNSAAHTAATNRSRHEDLNNSIVELRVSASREWLGGPESSSRLLLAHNLALPDLVTSPRGPNAPPPRASVFAIDPKAGPTVLVTYMDDDTPHLKKVRWLCKNLRENRQCPAQVFTDDTQQSGMVHDTMGYLDEVFRRADNIVVVVSKGYKCAVETDGGTAAGHSDVHSRNCCYLYRLMAAEYRDSGAINRRFRPVIFNSKDYEYLPMFLKNTLTFLWPNEHDKLMQLMFDKTEEPAVETRNPLVVRRRNPTDQSG